MFEERLKHKSSKVWHLLVTEEGLHNGAVVDAFALKGGAPGSKPSWVLSMCTLFVLLVHAGIFSRYFSLHLQNM